MTTWEDAMTRAGRPDATPEERRSWVDYARELRLGTPLTPKAEKPPKAKAAPKAKAPPMNLDGL